MTLMLDASVAMRWLADGGSDADKAYAKRVLKSIFTEDNIAYVPSHWTLEIAHILSRSEKKGSVAADDAEYFLNVLNAIKFVTDFETSSLALTSILSLSRRYGLPSYDAAYLELAMRLSVPLATLDKELRRAAERVGVPLA